MMNRSRVGWLIPLALGLGAWGLARWWLGSRKSIFRNKVVLITGASRGIGRALAHAFAGRRSHLVLASRNEQQLQVVASECRAVRQGTQVLIVPTDVTDEQQLASLVNRAIEHFGRIDVVVNNAGIIQGGSLADTTPDMLKRHLEVNVLSAVRLTQLVLPIMHRQRSGYIVNIASASGRHTMPYFIAYGISKHAMVGFSEGVRRELAGTGIRVLTVNPGYTDTQMVSRVGVVYRRLGFTMIPPQRVARRTLEAMALGLPEVNIGWLETIGQYASVLAPRLADLFWQLFMPPDFPELASQQRTE
jgi:short-subunit dehydrogenase